MSELEFRLAESDDLSEIVRIYNSTIPGRMVTADLNPVTVESRIPWFNKHNPELRPLWVAQLNKKIIGWSGILPFHERAAYEATAEVSLYLDEDFRGHGYGREILRHVLKVCPQYGIETLVGLIFEQNIPSIHLFLKEDFEEWGFLPNVANLDGEKRGLKIFGKAISK